MRLKEFAPSPERDNNDDVPDQLVVLANRWWNATDKQPQIEHVLNSLGWSIHQVESEDDAVQLQHRDGTTYFISADDFDPDLFEIAKIPQGDFGDADTLSPPKYDTEKKPLPGGSGFTYAVGKTGTGDLEIMIFDGDTLAAELDLFETQDVTNAWRVNTVAVDPEYRSRGLGKALYGIALSILRLTLEAGDTQTKHGQRMWLMLNSIPGVEVLGYNMERTPEYKPRPGDKIIAQDNDWTRYTFPVRPGERSMRSSRKGTGIYSSASTSMIAKWTGQ
jgi:GNAT superfamily N-acetyltransferase